MVPAFTSSTARTGSPEAMRSCDIGVVFSAMRAMTPSSRTNTMSSDSSVFFIQNSTGRVSE
jgi:hypothetical protein